jgi:glycerol-3-phosphate dehydrogenase (NAD(P)+)
LKILFLGAGAWGTALAVHTSKLKEHKVTLWSRNAEQAQLMLTSRINTRYLPGIELPRALNVAYDCGSEFAALCAQHDLILIASPVAGLRSMFERLQDVGVPVAWLCKGVEPSAAAPGLLGHEILAQVAPHLKAGILSGPSFALEVARGQPTALVAASSDALVRQHLLEAFHSPSLRVYANDDVVGVEVGGAVKNILAIATGMCDGLQLGLNARAALITRGLAEMARLGVALGARTDTFMGLSGLGDLVLTCTGDLSRNRKVGLLLAQGLNVQSALATLGHVAEGVHCAQTVAQRAMMLGVEMPITQAVAHLLSGVLRPQDAVSELMGRLPAADTVAAASL